MTPPPPVPDGLHVCAPSCPYCGRPLNGRAVACSGHRDLLALDPYYSERPRRTITPPQAPTVDYPRREA